MVSIKSCIGSTDRTSDSDSSNIDSSQLSALSFQPTAFSSQLSGLEPEADFQRIVVIEEKGVFTSDVGLALELGYDRGNLAE